MAAILKDIGHGSAAVRPLTLPFAADPVIVVTDRHAVDLAAARDEAARLRAEVDRLRGEATAAAARSAAAIRAARAAAFAEGRDAGLAAAQDRARDRVAALAKGMATEAALFATRLDALDGLAVALARAALDKLFACPDDMARMVTATLARHAALLRDQGTLAVRVSAADFDDAAPVEHALGGVERPVAVTIDARLPAGACRVTARLGQIDLDVPGQWTALVRLLDAMAGE